MSILSEILQAQLRIHPYVLKTPLLQSFYLTNETNNNVYLKLESEQYTGSFKVRGSTNKILSLTPKQKKLGVLTSSTGNHGLAFARAIKITGVKGTVYLPRNADKSKIEAIEQYGVDIESYGEKIIETNIYAQKIAKERGMIYVSPYNDPQVIGGQGTIGLELAKQLRQIDVVFVTIGGGGLISGIATYLKTISPKVKIIGCLPENSPGMYECIKAGKIVTAKDEETLSTGSAGNILPDAITFDLCRKLVDEYVLITEDGIKEAIRLMAECHHKLIEGAAGVALASYLKTKGKYKNKNIVIIICGANIPLEKLKSIL